MVYFHIFIHISSKYLKKIYKSDIQPLHIIVGWRIKRENYVENFAEYSIKNASKIYSEMPYDFRNVMRNDNICLNLVGLRRGIGDYIIWGGGQCWTNHILIQRFFFYHHF